MEELRDHEKQALELAAQGKKSKEIGEILGVTKRTVDSYFQIAYRMLGARNRMEAVNRARELGVIG